MMHAALRRPDDPRSVEVDCAVYGATPGGIIAAVSAKRHGLTTAIIGGWRERVVGGMMTGGLGVTDLNNDAAVGGISREVFDRLDAHYGRARGQSYNFEPSVCQAIFEQMLDEEGIPVYWTTGIDAARREGNRLRGFRTRDGLNCSARVFVDASYEGDLVAYSGVPYRYGREPQYLFGETYNGVSIVSKHHNFVDLHEAPLNVDPFITPGDPGSGLCLGIKPISGAIGAGDTASQAFNFRVNFSNQPENRRPLMTEPPRNYNPARYEILARYIEALIASGYNPAYNYFAVFGPVPNGKCDLNAARAFSTDPFGDNWGYVDAGFSETRAIDYDLRETIWQDHIDFHMGLFWFFHDPSNTRCPANVRNGWRNWWLPYDEHTDPWPGDPAGFPTQLYVREGRRIISDVTLTQYDMSRADSATVPFDDVIGLGSYSIDSHHCNRIALEYAPGQFRAWNEGSVYAVGGGSNNLAPIPYRALRPRKVDCDNLLTPWAVSGTHVAFGLSRMEPTAMQMGHVCGIAARMALDGLTQAAVQDIDTEALRATLRREGVNVDAT
jgi:hypothetical protein